MGELIKLLSLYQESPWGFNRAVRKATKKKLTAKEVISMAKEVISKYEEDLETGVIRPVRSTEDLLSVIKLGKHLVGQEVYRIWSGGKNGKICSKVTIKGISIQEDGVYLETQANYSSSSLKPVTRVLSLFDMSVTWFLTEEACKKAIERL